MTASEHSDRHMGTGPLAHYFKDLPEPAIKTQPVTGMALVALLQNILQRLARHVVELYRHPGPVGPA